VPAAWATEHTAPDEVLVKQAPNDLVIALCNLKSFAQEAELPIRLLIKAPQVATPKGTQ
jgi:hypothetical protein